MMEKNGGKRSQELSTTSLVPWLRLLSVTAPTTHTCSLQDRSPPHAHSPGEFSVDCAASRTQDPVHVTDSERGCDTGSEVRA